MLTPEYEGDALETLRQLGFTAIELPKYGVDPDGNPTDMVKMILEL